MYSIIDIESNGAAYRKEKIIEVAIYRYDGHKVVDQFISLVNPEEPISPFVQRLTGITPKMVRTAPKFHEIAKRIVEITEGTTLVGHNIDFDYRMLRQSFRQLAFPFKIKTIDTIPLAKNLIPDEESYSLSKLCKSVGIPLTDAHRASGDARATLELFKLLIVKDTDSQILQSQYEESESKTYINKIKELTEDLPAEKGIVYFQNTKGEILYNAYVEDVYKSTKKIFNSKSKRWLTIQQEVEQIHYELTGTEIVAKMMMLSKGIRYADRTLFGLFYRNEKWMVDKIIRNEECPILKFKSFSQGTRILKYISSKEEFQQVENLEKHLSLHKKNQLLISKGRELGENSFLILKNGQLTGYGFYNLHTQIQNSDKINKIKVAIKPKNNFLENDLRLGLLKQEFKIKEFPA